MIKSKRLFLVLIILIVAILFPNIGLATEVNITNTENTKFHNPPSIQVPEININLKINNLTRGCNVYILLSENILKYNMEKFINNNLDNPYEVEAKEAQKVKKFLDSKDYLGYIEYYKETGFNVEENEIELRHYCFCLGNSETVGYLDYNGAKYIQIKINLNDNNEFKVILKDYFTRYDIRDTKFLIDEYGSKTYIDLNNIQGTTNSESTNITDYDVTYNFYNTEDYESIERATNITYLIIYIILIILALVVLRILIKRHIAKKEEIEARKFWKKRLTKEEKKEQKKIAKDEKKNFKKEKNKRK